MSRTLSAAAIAAFHSMLKLEYQDKGKLRGCVTLRTGVTGSTYRFPNLGAGIAYQRSNTQTDVIPMNLVHGNQTATLTNWAAAEYTDVFDESKTNVNEREAIAVAIAKAISRREDQLVIDAMEAASSSLTVAASVGGSATDLNVDKIKRVNRLLGDQGVEVDEGMEKITYIGSHQGKESLLDDTTFTSGDYNDRRALVSGKADGYAGIQFAWIATRAEGGLTKSSNDRTSFALAQSALGLAVGIDFKTEVNYVPEKTSHLACGIFTGGAVHIDADGIVEMTTTEAA